MTSPRGVQLRRGRPRIILLDANLGIAAADWTDPFVQTYLCDAGGAPLTRLPAIFEDALCPIVHAWADGLSGEVVIEPVPGIIFRIARFLVDDTPLVALFVEQRSRRGDVNAAADRFGLTPREREVLALALQGMRDGEIAQVLRLSSATVADHFKSLLRKTEAKNRTDLSARVLGWSDR